jgi:uncharacterized membrane protein YhaH (DUF805 family)
MAFVEISHLAGYSFPLAGSGNFYILAIIAFIFVAYITNFSLRRLIDIGCSSWNMALFMNYAVANALQHISAVYPFSGRVLLAIYYLAMLSVPTAAISKKSAIPPEQIA